MGEPADNADAWLVVPVHNEATVIAEVIGMAVKVFPNVVCVDDGSTDDSATRIRTTGAHLVRHPVNLGQGAALQTGVEYARAQPGARCFVTYDADGQHRIEDVLAMLCRLRTDEADIVLGSRFLRPESVEVPWLRGRVLRAAALLSPQSRRLHLTDAHNGLRVFNRRVADALELTCGGMAHAAEFVGLIDAHGWRAVEEPVHIIYTEYSLAKGQSLVNGVNILTETAFRRRVPQGRR
jgi:glycosyltransferase involved in cell wall biosynthesis